MASPCVNDIPLYAYKWWRQITWWSFLWETGWIQSMNLYGCNSYTCNFSVKFVMHAVSIVALLYTLLRGWLLFTVCDSKHSWMMFIGREECNVGQLSHDYVMYLLHMRTWFLSSQAPRVVSVNEHIEFYLCVLGIHSDRPLSDVTREWEINPWEKSVIQLGFEPKTIKLCCCTQSSIGYLVNKCNNTAKTEVSVL